MRISDWSSDVCFRSFAVVGAAQVGLRHDDNVANGDLAHDFGMGCQVPAAFDGVQHRDDTSQGDVVAQPGNLEDRCDDGRGISHSRRFDDGFLDPVPALSARPAAEIRSEEHTYELQSLMRISYAACCLTKKKQNQKNT